MTVVAQKVDEQWFAVHEFEADGETWARRIAGPFISELAARGWVRHGDSWQWLDDLQAHAGIEPLGWDDDDDACA
jgi:hypothetical protein